MLTLQECRISIDAALAIELFQAKQTSLYEPITYLLELGGKRIRPSLVLLGSDLFGGDHLAAMGPALAIEWFHNFSLMHDDIMDKAPLRRGETTVHEKWGDNQAILSGDAMLVQAYQLISQAPRKVLGEVMSRFSQVALEVCEGQQLDMEFESRDDVSKEEYLEMIRLKTSVLLAEALRIGAVMADAHPADQQRLYDFGLYVGLSFQLLDDYLDAFGDSESFGKQVGGDILSDKKTYLYLLARQEATADQLKKWDNAPTTEKVKTVLDIYKATGADEAVLALAEEYHQTAIQKLTEVRVVDERKKTLMELAENLLARKS